jgi:hypothetical protein
VAVLLGQQSASGQQALRSSMTSDLAVASRRGQSESQPSMVKWGDFRLTAGSSLGLTYNDNVTLSSSGGAQDDFILAPMLHLDATYPITAGNILHLNLGAGYNYYFSHSDLSTFLLTSGSELSFDMYVKDFRFNFHDRFNYTQNDQPQAAVANTGGLYGGFDNTAGLSSTWDLQDLILTLGYDHENFIASNAQYAYTTRASELLVGRAGFQINPRLTAGVETTGAFTGYEQHFLNDNSNYSGGAYVDWQPGTVFRVQGRAGYTAFLFDQTSHVIKAVDQDTWYASLNLTHDITRSLSYSLQAGHELQLGIQADSIEDTYVRAMLAWKFIRNLTFTTNLSYESGTQGGGAAFGNFQEDFDWWTGGLGLNHAITKKLSAALNYTHTFRTSSVGLLSYSQNMVGVFLSYQFQ